MLNRAVLIVRPKQPFLDWAAQLDDSGLVPEVTGEQTVYLVPEFEDDAEVQHVLKRIFAEVFERELFGWHTDETAWPKHRTFAMFRQWFQIERTLSSRICVIPKSSTTRPNHAFNRTVAGGAGRPPSGRLIRSR